MANRKASAPALVSAALARRVQTHAVFLQLHGSALMATPAEPPGPISLEGSETNDMSEAPSPPPRAPAAALAIADGVAPLQQLTIGTAPPPSSTGQAPPANSKPYAQRMFAQKRQGEELGSVTLVSIMWRVVTQVSQSRSPQLSSAIGTDALAQVKPQFIEQRYKTGTTAANWRDAAYMEDGKSSQYEIPPDASLFGTGVARSLLPPSEVMTNTTGAKRRKAGTPPVYTDYPEELKKQLAVRIGRKALQFTVGMEIKEPTSEQLQVINTSITNVMTDTHARLLTAPEVECWVFHEREITHAMAAAMKDKMNKYQRQNNDTIDLLTWHGTGFAEAFAETKGITDPGLLKKIAGIIKAALLLRKLVLCGKGPVWNDGHLLTEPQAEILVPLVRPISKTVSFLDQHGKTHMLTGMTAAIFMLTMSDLIHAKNQAVAAINKMHKQPQRGRISDGHWQDGPSRKKAKTKAKTTINKSAVEMKLTNLLQQKRCRQHQNFARHVIKHQLTLDQDFAHKSIDAVKVCDACTTLLAPFSFDTRAEDFGWWQEARTADSIQGTQIFGLVVDGDCRKYTIDTVAREPCRDVWRSL